MFAQYLVQLVMPFKKFASWKVSRVAAAAIHLTTRMFKSDLGELKLSCPKIVDDRNIHTGLAPGKRRRKGEDTPSIDTDETERPEIWGLYMQRMTGYTKSDIMEVENFMSSVLRQVGSVSNTTLRWLKNVKNKYARKEYFKWSELTWS
eukprot:GHVR01109921.1.p2 GENE.GHVR01109921.1~~GHVR01109921.1.p2  ORF type:complete len:148 (-),score=24.18 GHVR01109921.1:217-660(-)